MRAHRRRRAQWRHGQTLRHFQLVFNIGCVWVCNFGRFQDNLGQFRATFGRARSTFSPPRAQFWSPPGKVEAIPNAREVAGLVKHRIGGERRCAWRRSRRIGYSAKAQGDLCRLSSMGSPMAGRKFDRADLGHKKVAQGCEFDDIPCSRR